MASSQLPSQEPKKDTLIESTFVPSLKSVLYNETRRIKKITTALYVVTEHFDDNDNLKRHIRQYASDLLKVSHVPYNSTDEELEFRMSFILSYIDAIMSFIEVAYAAQTISEANAQLLLRELRSVSIHVHHRYQEVTEPHARTSSLLEDIDIQSILSSQGIPKDTSKKPHTSEISTKKETPDAHTQAHDATIIQPLSGREERKEHILAIIKKKGTANIKDIAIHIHNCSEKTLQRDVKDLIKEGRVIKEGNRKWTVYKIEE